MKETTPKRRYCMVPYIYGEREINIDRYIDTQIGVHIDITMIDRQPGIGTDM